MKTQTPRIGFCCKWSEYTKKGIESVTELNNKTTTVSWLNRQRRDVAEQRMWELMVHNLSAIHSLVVKVSGLDKHLKMVRLGSDILPMYTEPTWRYFWRRPDVVQYCEQKLHETGRYARANDVRLSFHPGQFCVLASESSDVVNRSIEEFEYHADMVRWMGYGNTFQDFKINVHIAGRAGAEGIRSAYTRLSPEARNCITIENEEITHGLDTCLELADLVPIVLDIHHHYIHSGEYIDPHDSRVRRVIDSWRDVRPAMHYSVSREDVMVGHDVNTLPDLRILLEQGHKKAKLRAHSDFYWNQAVNDWALGFLEYFDIQCESKCKNLASFALADRARQIGVI